MNLDFTKLDGLSIKGSQEAPHKSTDSGNINDPGIKTPAEELGAENPAKSEEDEILQGLASLQREANANRMIVGRASAVYREYQGNIKTAARLQTDIVEGVKGGEDIYTLFLMAAQVISCMTANTVFYDQIRGDILAVYGAGLSEQKPLEIELEEVQGRLGKLREASRNSSESADSLQRIRSAIQAHEQREAYLKNEIAQAAGGGRS